MYSDFNHLAIPYRPALESVHYLNIVSGSPISLLMHIISMCMLCLFELILKFGFHQSL